jgi:hypothetical protein
MTAECLSSDSVPPKRRRRNTAHKPRLHTLEDLDGRTAAAAKAKELIAGLESDLGGSANITVGRRELCRHAALLGALVEDYEVRWLRREPVEIPDYLAAVNAQRRLLVVLGLDRAQRDVTAAAERDDVRELLGYFQDGEDSQ